METRANYIAEKIRHFEEGFGHLVYADGLLACAQIKASKSDYDFNPTVLRGPLEFANSPEDLAEFRAYLSIIKQSGKKPLRERFIITGQHWITGDIQIDADGKVQVLFLDSMGLEYPVTSMHINTAEPYRERKLANGGTVHCIPIPLSLMRTTLSSRLYTTYIPQRSASETSQAVSKRGELLSAHSPPSYFQEEQGKRINKRLQFALQKFTQHTRRFLEITSATDVDRKIMDHTLEGFRQRMGVPVPTVDAKQCYYAKLIDAFRRYEDRTFKWRSEASIRLVSDVQEMMADNETEEKIHQKILEYIKNDRFRCGAKSKLVGFLFDAGVLAPTLIQIQKGGFFSQRKFSYNASTAAMMEEERKPKKK